MDKSTNPHHDLSDKGLGAKLVPKKRVQKLRTTPDTVFLERVHSQYPYIEVLGTYTGANNRVMCKCSRCNYEWSPMAKALTTGRSGCPSCAGRVKKSVRCIETGVIYESLNKVEKETGISHSRISMCCNHKANSAGGLHWEFVSDV